MNKKDQQQIQVNWLLTILAVGIGFFVNMAANAAYDIFKYGFQLRIFILLVIFSSISIFSAGFLSYIFDKMHELKDESKNLNYFLWKYIKYLFHKSQKSGIIRSLLNPNYKIMPFDFRNLNENREIIASEVDYDVEKNSLYTSKRFTPEGKERYPSLLKEAILKGNEVSLGESLNTQEFFREEEQTHTKDKKLKVKQVPRDAAMIFSNTEFNKFYMRGICLKAIQENKNVIIYRAKEVEESRQGSESILGNILNPKELLDELRSGEFNLPSGLGKPNSGLSIHLA